MTSYVKSVPFCVVPCALLYSSMMQKNRRIDDQSMSYIFFQGRF